VVAEDADDDKHAVPRPTITSEEEEEASTWWGPTTTVTERRKPREEAKPKDTKTGLAGSAWAPKPKPAPKDSGSRAQPPFLVVPRAGDQQTRTTARKEEKSEK
jgi:hypothetical protein